VNGAISSAATVTDNGTVNFAGNPTSSPAFTRTFSSLTIGNGGLGVVALSPSTIFPEILSPTTLTITGTGKLDLGNNELQTFAAASAIRTLIINGAIFTTHTGIGTALGYADQGAGQVEVRYTLLGDTNLDGKVDVTDLGNLASSYGAGSGAQWVQGDTNYDGKVDVTDLGNLASYYGGQLAAGSAAGTASDTAIMVAQGLATLAAEGQTSVPEPSGLTFAAVASLGIMRHRRRQRVSRLS
jgi:hypothetical protein